MPSQKRSPVDVVYLDLQKAFDSVPHNRLLLKVESYGISYKFLGWIKSFLSDREQCVVLNSCKSGWQKVLSRVPQGSILGPLLSRAALTVRPRPGYL